MGLPEDFESVDEKVRQIHDRISFAVERVQPLLSLLSAMRGKARTAMGFLRKYRALNAHPEIDSLLDRWMGGPED